MSIIMSKIDCGAMMENEPASSADLEHEDDGRGEKYPV